MDAHTEQGQQLARRLYDLKIPQLENMSEGQRDTLLKEFPLLNAADFKYVVEQLVAAKRYQQERVGWQAVPHDIAVLVLILVTSLTTLAAGVIAGVAVLVLLEILFQVYYHQRLYQILSLLVWLTYPAYIWLGYVLYQRGFNLVWVVITVLLVWGGTFVLGLLARLPYRMLMEARARNAASPSAGAKPASRPNNHPKSKPKK